MLTEVDNQQQKKLNDSVNDDTIAECFKMIVRKRKAKTVNTELSELNRKFNFSQTSD